MSAPDKTNRPSYDEVLTFFTKLSNWGRWGPDDQIGTLNLLTPERRRAAAALLRTGETVACSRQISPSFAVDNPEPMLHHMLVSGADAPDEGFHGMSDWFAISPHGFAVTHLDALNHMAWNGRLYNDRPAASVSTRKGGAEGSIEVAGGGIVGRGVLLDVPAMRGVPWLDLGEAVGPEDLDACEAQAGLTVGAGDILLVRTGRDALRAERGPWDFWRAGSPGLHASCLPWLRERDVAVLVSDTGQDVMPSGYDELLVPVHAVALTAMGLWLLDNAYLEDLASTCARLGTWEFLFATAPLRLKNTTGSPVTPLALF